MVEVIGSRNAVSGVGSAYHVRNEDGRLVVDIHLGIDKQDVI